jgi:hypothetical protein
MLLSDVKRIEAKGILAKSPWAKEGIDEVCGKGRSLKPDDRIAARYVCEKGKVNQAFLSG